MSPGFQALRAVDFNWTHALHDIWSDPLFHVEDLHRSTVDSIMDEFRLRTVRADSNPIGQVISGRAGAGKTHLIGTLRRRVWEARGWFVLLDIVGISDFWATAALGFVESLGRRMPSGLPQHKAVISAVLNALSLDPVARRAIAGRNTTPSLTKLGAIDLFLDMLRQVDQARTLRHQDVVRALILLDSEDSEISTLAYSWLLGNDVDEARRRELKFATAPPRHVELVRGMLWIMSLAGPTLIAVDQIDSIVSEANIFDREAAGGQDSLAVSRAQSIVQTLAGGLMDLHDVKRRAMTVVSCLEVTWPILEEKTVAAAADRFQELPALAPIGSADIVENLILGRLAKAYKSSSFVPPYPTWPFRPEAMESAVGLRPRAILIRCQEHRQRCMAAGEAIECLSLAASGPAPQPRPRPTDLEADYQRELKRADISGISSDETSESAAMSSLLVQTCEILLGHLNLPDNVDGVVKPDPSTKNPSLHARLTFEFHDEGGREQHYCFRSLGHGNPVAFQARLKAAMTASGIDTVLKFRHLFILRRGDPPGGAVTKALLDQFAKAGGRFIAPTDQDLRVFVALRAMVDACLPGFEAWLLARKPLFDTALFKAAGLAPPSFLSNPSAPRSSSPESPPQPTPVARPTREPEPTPAPTAPSAAPKAPEARRVIAIGRRVERGAAGDFVSLSADLLPRHVAILAGTGSGKTVLLRRIVEEAALLGIPAIVLDVNNDLSRLGDPWPTRPEGFSDEDAAKAADYRALADVVVWTPGVGSGHPLSLNLLPDFAAIGGGQDRMIEDERAQAVEMAQATLEPYLGGTGQKAILKRGVLADALRAFARRGGGALDDLIGLLSELPDGASLIGDAPKLAGEIANQLLAAVATNPLLKSSGPSLDPSRFFHGGNDKTRISVINLAGLASDSAKQSFVNQLQMALFTWIKQNPSPTGRLYVLDEAQNFAPSQSGTPCKRSALSLAAQARKYGLGMIFATQHPKGIDNAIVSNCTTHFYGRVSAPATIETIQEMIASKGGAAEDIGRLGKGEFYFSTEGVNRPLKIRAPLCLSFHPANPPTPAEVLEKARAGINR